MSHSGPNVGYVRGVRTRAGPGNGDGGVVNSANRKQGCCKPGFRGEKIKGGGETPITKHRAETPIACTTLPAYNPGPRWANRRAGFSCFKYRITRAPTTKRKPHLKFDALAPLNTLSKAKMANSADSGPEKQQFRWKTPGHNAGLVLPLSWFYPLPKTTRQKRRAKNDTPKKTTRQKNGGPRLSPVVFKTPLFWFAVLFARAVPREIDPARKKKT